ncbi:hypothetical protein T440DRAFT_508415 [Plenodomus tracheiphilus IPT5]|uniref:Uncharacterized protein n=1 Tax=Plenodomus tracheiphilus IPT5 TaxID=1408161 RepID=A0A6A7B3H4_9PLEO|nr:hypothetical protein T440DRAFT_508415 [Plenodomus tracheiphilus IPT5]
MVPSPRKTRRASSTTTAFNQTWDEKDAASFDPSALPVAKIPRGWERKPETSRVGQGKEKKIWRRHDLRSRASKTLTEQDIEEEQLDAHSRAVKRRQHMSPKAMEKTTSVPNGTKRAFKATRWDRRKSVLPRKRAVRIQDPLNDMDEAIELGNDDSQDMDEEEQEDSIVDISTGSNRVEHVDVSLPVVEDRRSTFTFSMDATAPDDLPDYESIDEQEEDKSTMVHSPTEDVTLAKFFRSPAKSLSAGHTGSPEKIFYPQLPLGNDPDTVPEAPSAIIEDAESEQATENSTVGDTHTESLVLSEAILESVEVEVGLGDNRANVAYPALPVEAAVHEDNEDEHSDTDMSDSAATSHVDDDTLDTASSGDEASGEDNGEFTEASLQLDIQRQCNEQSPQLDEEMEDRQPDTNPQATTSSTSKLDKEQDNATSTVLEIHDHEEMHTSRSRHDENHVNLPQPCPEESLQDSVGPRTDDITDGLTLSFTPAKVASADPTPRKLHSPPPPPRTESGPDDFTMTIAIDDDTAILKDFLTRAAASKAEKAATHRRESLQNRRDSDVIRNALASPRKVLEDKDPNSPSKYDGELTLDLSQSLTLSLPNDSQMSPVPHTADRSGSPEEKSQRGSARRSSRAKKSRLPAPASSSTSVPAQQQTSKINIRRADGAEVVVLKKSDAQELATLTRANTRKNKQGAFGVAVRLFKLAADAASLPPIDDSTRELIVGKNVRWDETLAYYQENPETLAEAESLATPDELSMDAASTPRTKKSKVDKNAPPKARRVRTVNGTPGKGLLTPASLLPEAVQQEKEKASEKETAPAPPQQLPRPKPSRIKKMPVASSSAETKLPTLDVAPVGVIAGVTPSRKSRLAAPKKVVLPQTATTATTMGLLDGKENVLRPGISDATPKKGIPAPKVVIPTTVSAGAGAGVESGLPRRRGRKY